MAGPGLLAYILTSKFDDHLPLYRLNEIFTRMGADIPDTTLVDWCGRAMKTLQPVIELIGKEIMASDLLHADDTPIRVLDRSQKDKGLGKGVRQGRSSAGSSGVISRSFSIPIPYHFKDQT
jgi:transposase